MPGNAGRQEPTAERGFTAAVACRMLRRRQFAARAVRLLDLLLPLAEQSMNRTRKPMTRDALRRYGEAAGLMAICAMFILLELLAVQKGSPLGHDESIYSTRAREMAVGESRGAWFADYRAPGLPWVLARLPIGFGEARFRMVVVAFGVLVIALTWYIGRLLAGPGVAVTGALATALSPVHMATSSLVLPDVPAAALGLVPAVVMLLALSRPRFPWWAWIIPPVSAMATWFRFGAPIAIGVSLTVIAVAHWGQIRPQLGRVMLLGAGTVGACLAVLTVPALTGSTVSALDALGQRQEGRNRFLFEALPDFQRLASAALGPWPMWLAVAALVLVLTALLSTSRRIPRGAGVSLAVVVVTVLCLAWSLPHGEGRYLAPAIPWAFIGTAAVLVPLAREFRPAVLWIGVAATLALMPEAALERMHRAHDTQIARFDVLRDAGAVVARSAEFPCPVVSSYAPQIEWYSHCQTHVYVDGSIPERVLDQAHSVVFVHRGKRQPSHEDLDEVFVDASAKAVVGEETKRRLSHVWVYGFDRDEG